MNAPAAPDYERIVVPLDGSDFAEHALPHAASLGLRYGASITLVRAYGLPGTVAAAQLASALPGTGPVVDPTPYVELEESEATIYLEAVAERLRTLGLTVECDEESDSAGHGIVEAAERVGADLIVMATHARGGLGRLFSGSVADYVLKHAHCPVLLVRVLDED